MRVQSSSLLVTICVCLLFVVGCAASATPTPLPPTALPPVPTPSLPPATATPASAGLPDALKAYVEAFNRGDANAVLAVLVDDGLMYVDPGLAWLEIDYWLVGYIEAADKQAVRNHLEWLFGKGTTIAIKECTAEGEKWRCAAATRDDCLGVVPRLKEWPYDITVKVKDGKIQVMLFATRSSSSVEGRADALADYEEAQKLVRWAQANRPGDLDKVASRDYGRANGELTSDVCKAYAATLKSAGR